MCTIALSLKSYILYFSRVKVSVIPRLIYIFHEFDNYFMNEITVDIFHEFDNYLKATNDGSSFDGFLTVHIFI